MPRLRMLPMLGCLVAGMALAHYPMLFTGLDRIQTDPGDTRLNNYLLEHSWLWLLQRPLHQSLWSAPFYYPEPNTGAFTDLLLGVAPPYWLLRALRFEPDTSFQLWMLTMSGLNYVAAWLLLRRALLLKQLAASVGAFMFAFGSSRLSQIGHPQLIPQFYSLAALYALLWLFRHDAQCRQHSRCRLAIGAFFAAMTMQGYAGYYYTWFLAFGLVAAGVAALLIPSCRQPLLGLLRRHWLSIVISGALSAAVLAPMLLQYVRVADRVGLRDFANLQPLIPTLASWIYLGPESWLYGWTARLSIFRGFEMEHEHRLGLGLATSAAALVGLWLTRRSHLSQLLALASLALFITTTTTLWGGLVSWQLSYALVPGASAIRAVSRVGLMLLIPASIFVALLIERLQARRQLAAALVVGFACLVEQGRSSQSFDKYELRADATAVASEIRPDCQSFLYSPVGRSGWSWWKHQLDAMWAGLQVGIPTINGYSGNYPPTWDLGTIIRDKQDEDHLDEALDRWASRWGLARGGICWVKLSPREARSRSG